MAPLEHAQCFLLVFVYILRFAAARQDPPPISSILLSQLTPQSITFLGNASFGSSGGIELGDPLSKSFDDAPAIGKSTSSSSISSGRALYNVPFQMLSPASSFESSFSFSMSPDSHSLGFVIVPNNQDLDAGSPPGHGFSLQIDARGNTIALWSGGSFLATKNASFDIRRGTRGFVWISYDCISGIAQVSVSNLSIRPQSPDMAKSGIDLSTVFNQFMFVGFSASSSLSLAARNTIYSWNFTRWTGGGHPAGSMPAPISVSHHKRNPSRLLAAAFTAMVLLAFLLTAAFAFKYIRRHKSGFNHFKRQHSAKDERGGAGLHCFSLKELAAATKGFNAGERLGATAFSRCYRGTLGDSLVVVKLLHSDPSPSRLADLLLASSSHKNLVRLLGWCPSTPSSQAMLVYDFVANGSLDSHLFGSSGLPWAYRHKVACGLAKALQHLHSKTIVHGNVKPSNVLLDIGFTARLGDFGLVASPAVTAAASRGVGTFGYVAPEAVQTGRCTVQTDVFAFGVVMLELACGRRAIENSGADVEILVDSVWNVFKKGRALEEAVDPVLAGLYDPMEMEVMVRLGLACSHIDPESRPGMDGVVKVLAGEVPPPMLEKEEPEALCKRSFGDAELSSFLTEASG